MAHEPSHADHEHSLLLDAPADAQVDLARRTADALRAAGYTTGGRAVAAISHQRAMAHANAWLATDESGTVAGSATRIGPVWYVPEIDPAHPDEMVLGRALAVFDDGAVYPLGSLPPEFEVRELLDQLDPRRRPLPLPLTGPWPPPVGRRGPTARRPLSSGSGRTRGSSTPS